MKNKTHLQVQQRQRQRWQKQQRNTDTRKFAMQPLLLHVVFASHNAGNPCDVVTQAPSKWILDFIAWDHEQCQPTTKHSGGKNGRMHLEADLGPFSHGILLLKDPESAEDDLRADAPAQAMVQLVELWLQVKSRQILCMRIAGEPSQGTEGRSPCRPQVLDFSIGAND